MSELFNLWLFVCAIAKFLAMTGVGLAGAVVVLAECCGFRVVALGFETVNKFGTGALRPEQSESGHVSGVKLEFVSDFLLASSIQFPVGGQLALLSDDRNQWATSPPRKEWRHA